MSRPLALLAVLLLSTAPTQAGEELVGHESIVEVEGASAATLYKRARQWFASAFVDSDEVLEIEDPEARLLLGKGSVAYKPKVFESSAHTVGSIRFAVRVQTKDGRTRIQLTKFFHKASTSIGYLTRGEFGTEFPPGCGPKGLCRPWLLRLHEDIKAQADAGARTLLRSFERHMKTDDRKADDDW